MTTATGDAQAIIETATAAAAPAHLQPGRTYAVAHPRGTDVTVLDRDLNVYRPRPRRKTGTVTVHDAPSFIAYWRKHALPESEVYADVVDAYLVAVINAHDGPGNLHPTSITTTDADPNAGAAMANDVLTRHTAPEDDAHAGWGDHRINLALYTTPQWRVWTAMAGRYVSQVDLAEHFEEHLDVFRDPTGADMLELAQTFQASRTGAFSSSVRLSTGETQLNYREDHDTAAGRAGQLTIPETFTISLAPYEGGPRFLVTARFRYRLTGTQLRVGYLLSGAEQIRRDAFTDILGEVQTAIWVPILRGEAMAPRE